MEFERWEGCYVPKDGKGFHVCGGLVRGALHQAQRNYVQGIAEGSVCWTRAKRVEGRKFYLGVRAHETAYGFCPCELAAMHGMVWAACKYVGHGHQAHVASCKHAVLLFQVHMLSCLWGGALV